MTTKKTEDRRFVPCSGSFLGAHPPIVFPEILPCKGGKSVFFRCMICSQKGFGYSLHWRRNGLTVAQVLSMCSTPIDGQGVPIS